MEKMQLKGIDVNALQIVTYIFSWRSRDPNKSADASSLAGYDEKNTSAMADFKVQIKTSIHDWK